MVPPSAPRLWKLLLQQRERLAGVARAIWSPLAWWVGRGKVSCGRAAAESWEEQETLSLCAWVSVTSLFRFVCREVREVVAALGSQLVLVVGSDSSCQLWELSLVPLHCEQIGRCHPAGMLGCFAFRVMASFLGASSLEREHRCCLCSCQALTLTSEAMRGSGVPLSSETHCPCLLCCVAPFGERGTRNGERRLCESH